MAVAKADPFSNKVKIWSSLQSPFTTREMLAQALGIPRGDLEITVPMWEVVLVGRRGCI